MSDNTYDITNQHAHNPDGIIQACAALNAINAPAPVPEKDENDAEDEQLCERCEEAEATFGKLCYDCKEDDEREAARNAESYFIGDDPVPRWR